LEILKSRIHGVQRQLNTLRGEARTQEQNLRRSELAIGRLSDDVRKTERAIRDHNQRLSALRDERTQLESSRDHQQSVMQAQLREAWQMGRAQRLRVLFNQENPETLSRHMTWYRYFNEARAEQITHYQQTIARLDAIEPEIVATTETLEAARTQLLAEQKDLDQQQQARKHALAVLNRNIRNTDVELNRLTTQRNALEALLKAVEDSIANLTLPSDAMPFAKARGRLPWPTGGKIAHSYGSARGSGMRWQGVLIRADSGQAVNAIHHGRVVFADWFRGLGLLVIVDHGDEYLSLYAHNQSLLKEVGEWVSSGERIATVGASGGQAKAGLYFEIRHQGKPENPARWCRKFG
jgi:septal ring factor EnvC (AmiA/AmiB activator)